jgi:hypothetical protein
VLSNARARFFGGAAPISSEGPEAQAFEARGSVATPASEASLTEWVRYRSGQPLRPCKGLADRSRPGNPCMRQVRESRAKGGEETVRRTRHDVRSHGLSKTTLRPPSRGTSARRVPSSSNLHPGKRPSLQTINAAVDRSSIGPNGSSLPFASTRSRLTGGSATRVRVTAHLDRRCREA